MLGIRTWTPLVAIILSFFGSYFLKIKLFFKIKLVTHSSLSHGFLVATAWPLAGLHRAAFRLAVSSWPFRFGQEARMPWYMTCLTHRNRNWFLTTSCRVNFSLGPCPWETYYPHFIDEGTEAQRANTRGLQWLGGWVVELPFSTLVCVAPEPTSFFILPSRGEGNFLYL